MKIACRNIDRLCSVMIRPEGMPREDLFQLYALLDEDGPVSWQIATALLEKQGARVAMVTGAADAEHYPHGESDGPLGTVALARALVRLGHRVSIYSEEECTDGIRRAAQVVGCGAAVEALALEPGPRYDEIARESDVFISIEKLGMNAKGIQHSITGRTRNRCKMDYIANAMNDAGKLTIGIGDGGNEIGFGKVYEQAREVLRAKDCLCGCGGGIITCTATTYLYPVAISNWGAYALCAALAIGAGRPDLIVEPAEEHALLKCAIRSQLVDGGSGKAIYAVDGVEGEASVAYVTMLKEIVRVASVVNNRPF